MGCRALLAVRQGLAKQQGWAGGDIGADWRPSRGFRSMSKEPGQACCCLLAAGLVRGAPGREHAVCPYSFLICMCVCQHCLKCPQVPYRSCCGSVPRAGPVKNSRCAFVYAAVATSRSLRPTSSAMRRSTTLRRNSSKLAASGLTICRSLRIASQNRQAPQKEAQDPADHTLHVGHMLCTVMS